MPRSSSVNLLKYGVGPSAHPCAVEPGGVFLGQGSNRMHIGQKNLKKS